MKTVAGALASTRTNSMYLNGKTEEVNTVTIALVVVVGWLDIFLCVVCNAIIAQKKNAVYW